MGVERRAPCFLRLQKDGMRHIVVATRSGRRKNPMFKWGASALAALSSLSSPPAVRAIPNTPTATLPSPKMALQSPLRSCQKPPISPARRIAEMPWHSGKLLTPPEGCEIDKGLCKTLDLIEDHSSKVSKCSILNYFVAAQARLLSCRNCLFFHAQKGFRGGLARRQEG